MNEDLHGFEFPDDTEGGHAKTLRVTGTSAGTPQYVNVELVDEKGQVVLRSCRPAAYVRKLKNGS